MRIGFDLRPAQKKNSRNRGVGRYVRELFRALTVANTSHELIGYTLSNQVDERGLNSVIRPLPHLRMPSRLNWVLELGLFPWQIRKDRLDIFHASDLTSIPRSSKARIVATVHDLIPYVYWDETTKRIPKDYEYALKIALRRIRTADHIVTDSEHSKRDLCELVEVDESKITVVYLGHNASIKGVPREEAIKLVEERLGIEAPFLFYVGGSDYRKNIPSLIRSFAQIREQGYQGRLVLAGETFGWEIPEVVEIKRQVGSLGLDAMIDFLGYVKDSQLGWLYSACDFFIFPSLYEGFGLPVLEAMRCGAPLLISSSSSIPEVAGDCAFYFDPTSQEDLLDTFWAAYEAPDKIETKVEAGRTRAEEFGWDIAGEKLLKLYSNM